MSNIISKLSIKNEKITPTKIVLEPIPQYYILQSSQRAVVHAIFETNTENQNLTIAPNEDFLVIYTPGEISGFVDCFVMHEGVILKPDGS